MLQVMHGITTVSKDFPDPEEEAIKLNCFVM